MHGNVHSSTTGLPRSSNLFILLTSFGQGPPQDFREFWRSGPASSHSWHDMCLTTAWQWQRMRTIVVQGGQLPGWHDCRHACVHPSGLGFWHCDSQGSQFSPACQKKDGIKIAISGSLFVLQCSLISLQSFVYNWMVMHIMLELLCFWWTGIMLLFQFCFPL